MHIYLLGIDQVVFLKLYLDIFYGKSKRKTLSFSLMNFAFYSIKLVSACEENDFGFSCLFFLFLRKACLYGKKSTRWQRSAYAS